MRFRGAVTVGVLAALCARGIAAPAAMPTPMPAMPDAVRFAIVIGNNAAERTDAGALRFADDDALAMHRLLGEAGVRSVLLARLDDATAQLSPGARSDGPPRWPELIAAFDRLAGEMRRERAAGRTVELLVFYSGHGDVAHGEGYVLLEDRRLTRRALAALLARSPAHRNHVIIDACKSYFMAFEKGPGGHRVPFGGGFVDAPEVDPGYLATTGFVLSTSSDRDSHEWDRFGGGVFSHEVRSALRGAADLDGDGRISYAELGAFLATASQGIANPRLRPDFLIRPPAGLAANLAEPVLAWDARIASAVVLDRPLGHVYVETAAGERVLDAHLAGSEQATLRVPVERPLFLRDEAVAGREWVIDGDGAVRVSELADQPLSIARRGAESLAFEQLFSVPFGHDSVRWFTERWLEPPAGRADPDCAGCTPGVLGSVQTAAGATAITAGLVAAGATIFLIDRYESGQSAPQAERVAINRQLREAGIAAAIAAPVAAVSGAIWLYARSRSGAPDTALAVLPFARGAPGVALLLGRAW